jgi:hypothetical protein
MPLPFGNQNDETFLDEGLACKRAEVKSGKKASGGFGDMRGLSSSASAGYGNEAYQSSLRVEQDSDWVMMMTAFHEAYLFAELPGRSRYEPD